MTPLVGGNEVTKILIGSDAFLNQENLWLPYPGGSGKLFYRLKGDSILQLWGIEPNSSDVSSSFRIPAIPGIKFKSWHATGTNTISGSTLTGGVVEGASYYMSTGAIFMYGGPNHKAIMADYGLFYLLDPANKAMDIAGLYPVEIDIKKE